MLLRNKVVGGLAIIVICLTNGWHLVPIQAFAWLSMAIEDSNSDNFTEALSSAMEGKRDLRYLSVRHRTENECRRPGNRILERYPQVVIS